MVLAQYSSVGGPEIGIFIVIWALIGSIFGAIASSMWKNKGGSAGAGFALGFFLGVIGILIAALATPSGSALQSPAGDRRECPHCKEPMRRDASVCPHCQRDSQAWTFHGGHWWVKAGDDGEWHYLDAKENRWVKLPAESLAPEG